MCVFCEERRRKKKDDGEERKEEERKEEKKKRRKEEKKKKKCAPSNVKFGRCKKKTYFHGTSSSQNKIVFLSSLPPV